MATTSTSTVQNPLNPLNLPPIVRIGRTLNFTGDTMEFDEKLLNFCFDRMVDFESLKVNGFDVLNLFQNQGWNKYFEILNGPIYSNLIKMFYMKSKVYDEIEARMEEERAVKKNPKLKGKTRKEMGLEEFKEVEIRSTVVGLDITITRRHFVKLLGLEDKGKIISEYKDNEYYRENIKKEMFIDLKLLGKYKGMNNECRVLFKILLSSILPRTGGVDTISWEHKHFIYFLLK
ncbi:cullin-like protein, partial [Trifolium medium]|nr:cullin-like protein [Trifolium medium]